MSLQIWIPFVDGTLKQQGLKELTLSSSNTSVQNNGKLGKCLSFNGSSSVITSSQNVGITGDASYTIAFWMYWAGDTWSNDFVGIVGWGSMSTNKSAYAIIYNGRPDLDFWNNRYLATNQLQVKKWYHIAMVKTPGNISTTTKIYVDGQEVAATANSTITPSIVDSQLLIGRLNNSTNRWFNGYLNDVRIYDHALSPMEVKELSKGLMLHYPLNRSGWGQENIAINTGTRSPDQTSQVEWKGFKIGNLPITEGEQLTVSFDLEMKIGTAITNARPYLLVYNTNYRGEHGQWIYASNSSTYDMIPSGTYAVGDIIKRRVSFTINAASTFNPGTQSEDWIEFYSNYSTENEITIKNIKIERGDTATPWCPNSSDDLATTVGLNSTIEYDCSGFGNNGVLNGINEYTSDTIRYNVSRIFNGVNNPVTLPNLSTLISDGIFTFSVWFKKETDQWSSKSWETIFGGPSGFEFSSKSRSTNSPVLYAYSWNKGTYNYTLDEWHHFVMVRTTSGTIFYLDGVQAFTGTAGSIPSGNYFLGAWSTITGQNYKGKMSDARIYATALSADDIQSLYADKGYIDNKGNVYGTLYEI